VGWYTGKYASRERQAVEGRGRESGREAKAGKADKSAEKVEKVEKVAEATPRRRLRPPRSMGNRLVGRSRDVRRCLEDRDEVEGRLDEVSRRSEYEQLQIQMKGVASRSSGRRQPRPDGRHEHAEGAHGEVSKTESGYYDADADVVVVVTAGGRPAPRRCSDYPEALITLGK